MDKPIHEINQAALKDLETAVKESEKAWGFLGIFFERAHAVSSAKVKEIFSMHTGIISGQKAVEACRYASQVSVSGPTWDRFALEDSSAAGEWKPTGKRKGYDSSRIVIRRETPLVFDLVYKPGFTQGYLVSKPKKRTEFSWTREEELNHIETIDKWDASNLLKQGFELIKKKPIVVEELIERGSPSDWYYAEIEKTVYILERA